ncbi:MAG: response regulator transcription factor, partial [Chloroflexota bacterium]
MSTEPHILVIDDESQILRALKTILTEKKFRVTTASTGEEGLTLAAATQPDVIILDLGLPDMDGLTVCERLREWTQIPIIVLSARDQERDKVLALDKGADDYLIKPFGIQELLARVRVALRHLTQAHGSKDTVVNAGKVKVDLMRHIVLREEMEVKLTATEFKLLAYLASNSGRVLTHHSILTNVWGEAEADNIEYLRVYMRQLRKK